MYDEIRYTERDLDESLFLNAAERMDSSLFRSALEEVLNDLPLEKKTVFVLRYQEDHTMLEISEIMNCSEGTVKSRLHYTLKILEERLNIYNPLNK